MIIKIFIWTLLSLVLLIGIIDELFLIRRRRHDIFSPLLKISYARLIERAIITLLIIVGYLFRWEWIIGGYIGYVTNALVTIIILKVYLPKEKKNIAGTFSSEIKKLSSNNNSNSNKNWLGTTIGILAGVFIPGGWLTTIGGGVAGLFTEKKTKHMLDSYREKEFERIANEIRSMNSNDITDMMDSIIGKVFIVIEILGFVFGVVFSFLFTVIGM